MSRTLVVTNDFPPRQGGIETFVLSLVQRLPPHDVVLYTASMEGDAGADRDLRFPVVRDRSRTLLPTPRLLRETRAVLRSEGCDRVLFGAAAPLGLLAHGLRAAGAERIVGMTHGHEVWWASVPGARRTLHRIGETTDVLTYVSEWCGRRIGAALSPEARARMRRLSPGVDADRFKPGAGGDKVRASLGIAPYRPVILCVARLIPRKGQDTLIRAMPRILTDVPDALLLLVGDGSYRRRLEQLAETVGVRHAVQLAGAVRWAELPPWFDAGDIFAMPCRTRRGGLEPEAFGIVFLEAQAAGLPVIVGDSGGAAETVRHGHTGYVVNATDVSEIASKARQLLTDSALRQTMGCAGRRWVLTSQSWDIATRTLMDLMR